MKIKLASDLQSDSIVDGAGLRTVLWTQGCPHQCVGCHNPDTHDIKGGFIADTEDIKRQISTLKAQDGITLTGGDPFMQIDACLDIATYCQKIGLNVWAYTGYTYEQLIAMSNHKPIVLLLLKQIDILVDGKFVLEKRSMDLPYRGSANQRIIDVQKSLKKGQAIVIRKYMTKAKLVKQKEKRIFV